MRNPSWSSEQVHPMDLNRWMTCSYSRRVRGGSSALVEKHTSNSGTHVVVVTYDAQSRTYTCTNWSNVKGGGVVVVVVAKEDDVGNNKDMTQMLGYLFFVCCFVFVCFLSIYTTQCNV